MSFDPNPYSASSTQPTTPKKSNVLTYLLIAGAVVLALCCGCGGVFAFLFNVGANQAAKLVRPQLQADPVIQQHIGDLETVEVSIGSLYSSYCSVSIVARNASKRNRTDRLCVPEPCRVKGSFAPVCAEMLTCALASRSETRPGRASISTTPALPEERMSRHFAKCVLIA